MAITLVDALQAPEYYATGPAQDAESAAHADNRSVFGLHLKPVLRRFELDIKRLQQENLIRWP